MSEEPTSSERQYAGFGLRFLAYWVDFLIFLPVSFAIQNSIGINPLAILNAQSLSDLQALQNSSTRLLGTVISLVFTLVYYMIFWVHYDGATPGKKLLGIKIIKDNGTPMTYPSAFIRYIGYLISGATVFIFGLGFLWVIWDKKKQAWHDKLAGTVVVKTGQKPNTILGVLLTILAILSLLGFMSISMYKGYKLVLQDRQSNASTLRSSLAKEKLQENQKKDESKILSYAPSSCGLTIPIPKTSDTVDGKNRKWLLEETPLGADSFYILDKDVFPVKEVQGAFLGYKDATMRLNDGKTGSFSVAFPGLNIYCVDNTKNLTLDEFQALALTDKSFTVEAKKMQYWGEVGLIPVTLSGKDPISGKEFKDIGNIGVTKDGSKLLYIRLWAVDEKDTNKTAINDDLDVIVRNLQYRGQPPSGENKSSVNVESNSNVKGVSTTAAVETASSK